MIKVGLFYIVEGVRDENFVAFLNECENKIEGETGRVKDALWEYEVVMPSEMLKGEDIFTMQDVTNTIVTGHAVSFGAEVGTVYDKEFIEEGYSYQWIKSVEVREDGRLITTTEGKQYLIVAYGDSQAVNYDGMRDMLMEQIAGEATGDEAFGIVAQRIIEMYEGEDFYKLGEAMTKLQQAYNSLD